ncbi:MAG TPA: DUF1963 domain-containing protein [Hyphomicrobium sp.]|nr:DUF1963 domain-containing protein [Hyphomicrobium sp.]
MFENKSDIAPYLAEAGFGSFSATVEALCVPAVCFEDRLGRAAAQFGGLPDVRADFVWPQRDAYPHGRQLADKLRRGPDMDDAFTRPIPLDFLCQIDLGRVAETGALGDRLPPEGQLLFFWDGTCGPWIESALSARVIWDRTPTRDLVTISAPQTLADHLADVGRMGFRRMTRATPLPVWSMPDRFLMQDLIADKAVEAELTGDGADDFWDHVMDAGLGRLTSGRAVLPHRLGGWPITEQWDPRYTAAAASHDYLRLFDRMPTDAERAACEVETHDWTMLLQVSLADLGTDYAEGTVYFVMRKADLTARDFSHVHAIYQQT